MNNFDNMFNFLNTVERAFQLIVEKKYYFYELRMTLVSTEFEVAKNNIFCKQDCNSLQY